MLPQQVPEKKVDTLPHPLTDLRKLQKGSTAWAAVQSRLNIEVFTHLDKIPREYICPLTNCFIANPVATIDGGTYEREAIEHYLSNESNKTFPNSNVQILGPNTPLIAVNFVQNRFATFMQQHPWVINEKYISIASLEKMRTSCHEGNAEAIKEVIAQDPRLLFISVKMQGYKQGNVESKEVDQTYLSPLHYAVRNEKSLTQLVTMLDTKPYGENGLGLAALLHPAENGQIPLETALRDERSDLRAILVMMAYMGDSLEDIKLTNASKTEYMQKTLDKLLGESIRLGRTKWVECLLKWGANVQTLQMPENRNALQLAISTSNVNIVKLCQSPALVNVTVPESGETVLHLALQQPNPLVMQALLEKPEFLPLLTVADTQGQTPLHHAAAKNLHLEVSYLLAADKSSVNHSNMINAQDNTGMTALHLASKFPDGEIVSRLLIAKADHSKVDKKGNTALHIAAREGSATAVELLLLQGAKEIRNGFGNTPLAEAALKNFTEIYQEVVNRVEDRRAQEQQAMLTSKNSKYTTTHLKRTLSAVEQLNAENTGLQEEAARLREQLAKFAAASEQKTLGLFTPRTTQRIEFQRQVRAFAELVSNSEADPSAIEAKLQSNPDLALANLETVTLAGKNYENINALQYAIATLNWNMLTLMKRHINEREFATQVHNYLDGGAKHGGACADIYSEQGFQAFIDQTENQNSDRVPENWTKLKELYISANGILAIPVLAARRMV